MHAPEDEVVFKTTPSSRRRAVVPAAVCGAGVAILLLIQTRWSLASAVMVAVAFAGVFLFVRSISPVGETTVRITREAVWLYDPKRKRERRVPRSRISSVENRVVGSGSSRREWIVFHSGPLEWAHVLPPGAPGAEAIVAAIRAGILPGGAATEALDAAGFFEVVFGILLPDTAVETHAEFHPGDMSGLRSVRLGRAEFLKLKTEAGSVSEWYPLTRDQRFLVGGRRLVGGVDLRGDYALSLGDGESTPALVWDAEAGVLHGLLTRSVG